MEGNSSAGFETDQVPLFSLDIIIYTTWICMVFSLILNSFIVLLMRNSDAFNEIDSILYHVLAVEDMIFFITGLSIQYLIKKDTTNCVHDTCHRWSSLRLIVSSAILYQIFGTLLTINLCRYLLIVKPLHYLRWITKRKVVQPSRRSSAWFQ